MASEIEWIESALKDLDQEIEYVNNEFGYLVAQKVYQKIMDHIGLLASFPKIGMKYEDMTFMGNDIIGSVPCVMDAIGLTFACPGDYREGSELYNAVIATIDKVKTGSGFHNLERQNQKSMLED